MNICFKVSLLQNGCDLFNIYTQVKAVLTIFS